MPPRTPGTAPPCPIRLGHRPTTATPHRWTAATGLGGGPPGRSWPDQAIEEYSIARSVNSLSCHTQYRWAYEVPGFTGLIQDASGRVIGCVSFHGQNNPLNVGLQVGQLNSAGIPRPPVPRAHWLVMEVENPAYGTSNPINGRWLHAEFSVDVMEVAVGSGGEVWYTVTKYPYPNGHEIKQQRFVIYPRRFTLANGQPAWGAYVPGNTALEWKRCSGPEKRRPGDETLPCGTTKFVIPQQVVGGELWLNPNSYPDVPHNALGDRLVPDDQRWVRCPELQSAIPPPVYRAGVASIHSWVITPPSRVLPVLPAGCDYDPITADVAKSPFAGYIGSPGGQPDDQASPIPPTATFSPTATDTPEPTIEPTVIGTPEPTIAPTDTPTPEPTATPTATLVAPVVLSSAHARYFANDHLDGVAVLERPEPALDFNWGAGSPDPTVPVDDWSAVFTTEWSGSIDALLIRSDDGVQVFVDDILVVERWQSGVYSTERFPVFVPDGDHTIRVTYNERGGDARLRVAVERGPAEDATPTATPNPPTATVVPVEATETPHATSEPPGASATPTEALSAPPPEEAP
jgi:hypothetical protein